MASGRLRALASVTSLGRAASVPSSRAASTRDRAAAVVSHAPPAGQPPTLGGRNGSWPSPRSVAASFFCARASSALGRYAEGPHQPDRPLHRLLDQARRLVAEGRLAGHGDRAAPGHPARSRTPRPAARAPSHPAGWPRPAGTTAAGPRTRPRPAGPAAGRRETRRRSRPSVPRICLGPVVVLPRPERGLAGLPVDLPAGQRPGGLAYVGLGVVAVAQREQLHELPGQVLVRRLGRVVVAVQPDQHGRVDDHGLRQWGERAERVPAEGLVLRQHQLRHLDLLGAGGEVPVPEPGQPLDRRLLGRHHPVQPPQAERTELGPHLLSPGLALGLVRLRAVHLGRPRPERDVGRRGDRRSGIASVGPEQAGDGSVESPVGRRHQPRTTEPEPQSVMQPADRRRLGQLAHGVHPAHPWRTGEADCRGLQQINRRPAR